MRRVILAATALGMGTTAAFAGGVERSNQSVGVLFEEGRYLEFGFTTADPKVSGAIGPFQSGDMTNSFLNFGAAYKADINEEWSYAIILNQPYGADVTYPLVAYPFAGSSAELKSNALTGMVKYTTPSNVSVYGGLRLQSLEATAVVNLPNLGTPDPLDSIPYTGTVERGYELGYLVGAAYERPDIALRVSLTYNSAIDYDLGTVETLGLPTEIDSSTEITTPKSLHLEFQTGIAADTLLFGGIRWVEWTEFSIAPQVYTDTIGSPLVSFEDDRITWTLGLGRRLNENWAVAGSVSYEEHTGSLTGNLGPTDGLLATTIGATYTTGQTEITAGVSYVDIGDANTTATASFENNSAIGFGMKVGYTF